MTLMVSFDAVGMALLFDHTMADAGVPCRVVPAPGALGAGCAFAVLVEGLDPAAVYAVLRRHSMEWGGVYRVEQDGPAERYTPVEAPEEGTDEP